jgi:RNA polymerase primary sigma factor
MSSADYAEPLFEEFEEQPVLPKRIKKRKKVVPPKPQTRSRSSTMPGFAQQTSRQKAFEDGIKLVESKSGRKFTETAKAKSDRKKQSSKQMYKTSASVPDSLVRFASEIHLEDRITAKEEKELGAKTQEAIRIMNLKEQLEERLMREPTDEEWCAEAGKINMEAIRQALEEGLEAKNQLVISNLRMVQGVVNIYIRNGLGGQYNAGDMMQEGIMALIRAAEKFEPQRGFRFSTYAMYWIRSAVKRSQIFQSRIIPVPPRLYENHKRLQRVEKELKDALGRQPTKKEIGDVVGMSVTQVERCMKAMEQRCYSLDQGITNALKPNSGDRDMSSMYDIVESKEDGEQNKQKRVFVREDLIETLNRHLDPEVVNLLLLRYGLKDDIALPNGLSGPLTIAEVSKAVGLKPDKVRRMINDSLKQLKFLIGEEWEDFERELS